MLLLGQHGFFWWLASIHVALGIFAVYRMARRRAKPVQEQSHYTPTVYHGSQVPWELTEDDIGDKGPEV